MSNRFRNIIDGIVIVVFAAMIIYIGSSFVEYQASKEIYKKDKIIQDSEIKSNKEDISKLIRSINMLISSSDSLNTVNHNETMQVKEEVREVKKGVKTLTYLMIEDNKDLKRKLELLSSISVYADNINQAATDTLKKPLVN